MRYIKSAHVLLAGASALVLMAMSVLLPSTSAFLVRNLPSRTMSYISSARALGVLSRKSTHTMARDGASFGELDGSNVRVGIISTRWNEEITNRLTEGVKDALKECNVTDSNIFETRVPGSFELPLAARFLALSQTVDAVVCVGCLIKGETMHFEHISEATCHGLMDVSLLTSTPVVMGVLTCNNEEQAIKRSSGDNNHGFGWGKTAVEMGLLRMSATGMIKSKPGGIGFGSSLADVQKEEEERAPGAMPKKIGF